MKKTSIFNYKIEELTEKFIEVGYKSFKVKQLFDWLYRKQVFDLNSMSNLAKDFKEYLTKNYSFELLEVKKRQISKDGTIKLLLSCEDGALIETVIMRHSYGNSVCVSSQVGCLMGCAFCASGLLKKQRDLFVGEMVLQVIQALIEVGDQRISNVVVMGSGEPFDNYRNVIDFLDIINSDIGIAIGARHLTVSTCGLVDGIEKFKNEKQYNLAISLHSCDEKVRTKLMPINQKYPLKTLQKALINYQEVKNRRISFEYILLKGINNREEDVQLIKEFIQPLNNSYLNLIPYNQVDEHGYQGVDDFQALEFYSLLKKAGIAVTLRSRHGDDIDAACGQLRNNYRGEESEIL